MWVGDQRADAQLHRCAGRGIGGAAVRAMDHRILRVIEDHGAVLQRIRLGPQRHAHVLGVDLAQLVRPDGLGEQDGQQQCDAADNIGDSERTASVIAKKVGVDEYYAEVLPEGTRWPTCCGC